MSDVPSCALYIVRNTPPFTPVREIITASNIDRALSTAEAGELHFDVSLAEGTANEGLMSGTALLEGSPLQSDIFREGTAILDRSTMGLPSSLWYVQRIGFDVEAGVAVVDCAEWRQLLAERQVPEGLAVGSRSATGIGSYALALANSRNPTYITMQPPFSGAWQPLPAFDVSGLIGQSVSAAFDTLAAASNTEWWIDYLTSWRHCEPRIGWGKRRGFDRRGTVHLTEGVHLSAATYYRDARDVPRIVRFSQGFAGPAGAVAVGTSVAHYRSSVAGFVTSAPESDRRRLLRSQGPALQGEFHSVTPSSGGDVGLLAAALRNIQTPIVAFQSVELEVRDRPPLLDDDTLTPYIDAPDLWSSFGLGDDITVRLTSPNFLAGVDLEVRVKAMQPDEASGVLRLVVEVL